MKKIFLILCLFASVILISCSKQAGTNSGANSSKKLYLFNAGDYIEKSVISDFEKEYGIEVVYDEFENNEDLYPIIEMGSTSYDCICPSDYMIQKMIQKDLLQKIDFSKLKNFDNIKSSSKEQVKLFDKEAAYTIPYMEGTVGILCNKTLLDEKKLNEPKSWADLWKQEYNDEILMQDNMRDCLMVGLKKNGFSLNSSNTKEIDIATEDLIKQKPLVQAYVVDQVADKMISGESMLAVIYSGDLLFILREVLGKYDLKYVVPEEGTNKWMDAWVIPKNAKNAEAAHLWLDYIMREDVAIKIADYLRFDTCNEKAYNALKDLYSMKEKMVYDYSSNNNESYNVLDPQIEEYYLNSWKKLKSK